MLDAHESATGTLASRGKIAMEENLGNSVSYRFHRAYEPSEARPHNIWVGHER